MELKQVKGVEDPDFKGVWDIYTSSIPADEQRSPEQQRVLFSNRAYSLRAAKEGELVGFIATWDLTSFVFVEHMAIKEGLRGRGLGARMLKPLLVHRKFVLEAGRPETEVARKRIRFYERLGFKLNAYDYIQPPYGPGKNPVPMHLMTYPEEIGPSEFSEIRAKIHKAVYGLEKPLTKISGG